MFEYVCNECEAVLSPGEITDHRQTHDQVAVTVTRRDIYEEKHDEVDDVVTDGGHTTDRDPTKLGYRTLAVLGDDPRPVSTIVSELRSHPAYRDHLSETAVKRTLRGLQEANLARSDGREWRVTVDGRTIERGDRNWRLDRASDRLIADSEPPTTSVEDPAVDSSKRGSEFWHDGGED